MKKIFIGDSQISIDKDFFMNLVENYYPGSTILLLKAIKLYCINNTLPTLKELREYSGLSEPTFRLYMNDLKNIGEVVFSVPGEDKVLVFKDVPNKVDISKNFGSCEKLDSAIGQKISATKKRINQRIRESIINPYIVELEKRGMGGVVYKNFRQNLFRELSHVVAQYKDTLSPTDIYNILISALDNEYLMGIGKATSIHFVFFNKTTSLVEKYVAEKKKKKIFNGYEIPQEGYFLVNSTKEVQNPMEYGYFVKSGGRFVHVAPEGKESFFNKISEEVEKRINGESMRSYDILFSGGILKEEESWRVGSCGKNNKFVRI